MFNKYKFNFNNELAVRINEKKFTQIDFDKLSKKNKTKVELTEINSFNDINKFSTDSIKYLYALNKNNFALIYDLDKKIYLAKIVKISDTDISKNSQNFINYQKQTSAKMIENIYNSYDLFLNNKYKVKINEKTVERVRNYFQ